MPNLRGASPVSRDVGGRSYAAQTDGGEESSRRCSGGVRAATDGVRAQGRQSFVAVRTDAGKALLIPAQLRQGSLVVQQAASRQVGEDTPTEWRPLPSRQSAPVNQRREGGY